MSNKAKKARNVAALSGGALVAAAPFASAGTAQADAAIFHVTNTNDSGDGSLRKAIELANATTDTDTIVFDAGATGTITLSSGALQISESVDIQGPGAGVVTIDADGTSMAFYVYNNGVDISVSMSDLTVTGGLDGTYGGGFTVWGENLELDHMVITGNTGKEAGAIYFYGHYTDAEATLTIRNSTISGNTGSSYAGGIYVQSAGAADSTGLLIENSTISDNDGTGYGGGLYLKAIPGDTIIRNSTISGNTAAYGGGGVYVDHTVGTLLIENSTITGNDAGTYAGGLYIDDSSVTPVSITNSIIAGNTAGDDGNDIYSGESAPLSIDYSLIGDTAGYTADAGTGNLTGDPMLGALADNGGSTKTHLPQAGSQVIDAGDPGFVAPPSTDQRGYPRVAYGRIDMGAVEVGPATLPPTGGSNGLMAAFGAGLLALGGALHLTGRRKRTA